MLTMKEVRGRVLFGRGTIFHERIARGSRSSCRSGLRLEANIRILRSSSIVIFVGVGVITAKSRTPVGILISINHPTTNGLLITIPLKGDIDSWNHFACFG